MSMSSISGVWQSSKYSQQDSVSVEDVREYVCLCVHGDLFPIGAKYIDSFKTSTTVAIQRKALLQLFCAVVSDMYEEQEIRVRSAPKASTKRKRDGELREPTDDYAAAKDAFDKIQSDYKLNPHNIRAYVETVKTEDRTLANGVKVNGRHVCFRLHVLTIGDSPNHIAESLRRVLRSNHEDVDKRLKGNTKFVRPLDTWQRLFVGVEPYARSCDMYLQTNIRSNRMDDCLHFLNHIGTPENPANPLHVFSLSNAIAIQSPSGVPPDQLNVDAYFRDGAPNGRFGRPFKFPEVAMGISFVCCRLSSPRVGCSA